MIYTFVTVFFIAVLSDTLQVRGLLQVYLRQYFSSERNLFRFLQSKDKFGSHTFCPLALYPIAIYQYSTEAPVII